MASESDGGTAIVQSAATIARLGDGPTVHERGRVDRGTGVIPISASGRVSLATSHRPRTALERLRWCGCHRRAQGLSAQTPTIPNTRKHSRGSIGRGLGWCLCNPPLRARVAALAFSGTAVVSADDPWRLHVSDSGSVEERPEHPRRRSLVTAGKRGQPPARDAGPDLEPKATVLLCRVDPEAASAPSGRFVAAPGRPSRKPAGLPARCPLGRESDSRGRLPTERSAASSGDRETLARPRKEDAGGRTRWLLLLRKNPALSRQRSSPSDSRTALRLQDRRAAS